MSTKQEEAAFLYETFRDNIDVFSETVCTTVVTGEVPDFHREIFKMLYTEDRIVIAAPRGFAKSTIVSKLYPLHLALFKKRKDICIISSSENLATEHLRYIKQEIESNPAILGMFGDLRSDKWSESHIIIKHPDGFITNVRAKGASGQIRGFRPDCVILDDIETDDSVLSEDQRKKLKNWLMTACINTLLPGGQLLLIGTVIHPLSVLSDLLAVPNGWKKKIYKAYIDGIEEEGNELWGKCRTHEWLQKRKKEIGSSAFASEYLNDPKADEYAPIKDPMIRYWEELPQQLSLSIAVDPAYSDDEKSDFKVAVLVGIDQNNNRYLVDYIRTHNPSGEFMDAVLSLYQQHKGSVTGLGVPNSGLEKEFYKSFLNKASDRKIYPPMVELKNTFTGASGISIRNKKKRITAALQPLFENGKYYIHANHMEAREELLTIGSSRWDDVVDAMCYAEQLLTPMYFDAATNNAFEVKSRAGACEGYGIVY